MWTALRIMGGLIGGIGGGLALVAAFGLHVWTVAGALGLFCFFGGAWMSFLVLLGITVVTYLASGMLP